MIRAYLFAALIFFLPLPAHAACTGPVGDGGDVLYNTDHRTLQWCDGAQWIAFPWPERNESSTLPDPGSAATYGMSIALDGTTALVGSPDQSTGGAAYVFDVTTGSLSTTIANPAPANRDDFGHSVALSGTTAVVGAPRDDPGGVGNAGTAYVFNAATGALTATLNNPSPTASDNFGFSVAVDGNLAVVGAYRDDPGGVSAAGTAYVFNATTGSLIATLNNPSPTISDYFGYSVALSGNTAVVGTPLEDDDEGGAGPPVLVFTLDSMGGPSCNGAGDSPGDILYNVANNVLQWCRENEDWIGLTQPPPYFSRYLENPSPDANDNYGISVALDGTTAVIGADGDNPGGINGAGRVRVFNAATGALISTLDNPAPDISDRFGASVAIDGTKAVVGAERGDTGAVNTGTAYVFNPTTGNLISTLANPTPASLDSFGVSVGVDANTAIIGAPQDDPGGLTSAGTAYVFNANTGALISTLNNPDPANNDAFGWSVEISGTTAIVGAHRNDPGGVGDAGTAYVFDATTGNLLYTLDNPGPDRSDNFAESVAISGATAIVGAPEDGTGGTASVFLMDGSLGTAPCTAPSGEPGDMLYNADYAVLQWCNGADWIGLPKP